MSETFSFLDESSPHEEGVHMMTPSHQREVSDQEKKQASTHAFHALKTNDIHFVLRENPDGPGYCLHLFHPHHPVALSDLWPLLEGIGLHIQTHVSSTWSFQNQGKVWVYAFVGLLCDRTQVLSDLQKNQICLGLKHVWKGDLRRGPLNRLLIEEGFPWRHVELLSAMVDYLRQLRPAYDASLIETTLLAKPALAVLWTQAFQAKFDPKRDEDRAAHVQKHVDALRGALQTLSQRESDVWGMLFEIFNTMVRTNFYQRISGHRKPYLAFKRDHHAHTPSARGIRFEIFVSAPWMQGVHFRAGHVARGGIRWSDRLGDFRREVWDLAQTQILKNAIIVPTGAKGGFVVTHTPENQTRAAYVEQGKKAYATLIQALLDVTDNQKEGCIIPPSETVCYDGADPYLVVAADKGTASFSDRANAISLEHGFWLGDAFASGGSHGYDHKKLGITSRGAWESVKRHGSHEGWHPETDALTVVGVGDMSGDVFGNGMLLSSSIRLVGAFDHRHIFLDPDPDPQISFQERRRLFELPGSQWTDYNAARISEGGGVFDRTLSEIIISEPVRRRFNITSTKLSPAELIRLLLKAPVDMMWLGGVGTFIKGRLEDEWVIGDQANQWVRIHGEEVQARVVVEGANLGVTQAARIQYARQGGRINTDTIDNSAGVHCSDYEVNLKILLHQALQTKTITEEERDDLLKTMTSDVVAKILSQNSQQNQILSLAEHESRHHPELYIDLRKTLKAVRKLGYAMARWPSERIILERGLMRPDLCFILAYSKIWLKDCLLKHQGWATLQAEHEALKIYFPESVMTRLGLACEAHPLKDQIVATVWTNTAINRYGPCFIAQKGSKLMTAQLIERMRDFATYAMHPQTQELWQEMDQTSLQVPFQETYQHYQSVKSSFQL